MRLLWIPLKERAKIASQVTYAIRTGRIKRVSKCSKCGYDKKIEAHHDDYAYPLNVRWLCFWCHWQFHDRRRAYILRSGRYPAFRKSKKQLLATKQD